MPVGPITLSDEVGIDISNHVGDFMSKADLGVRMHGGTSPTLRPWWTTNGLVAKPGRASTCPPKPKKGEKKQLNPEMLTMLKAKLREEEGIDYAYQLSAWKTSSGA